MEKSGRLSKITLGLGIYIVISASFMLQVNNWLSSLLGKPFMKNSLNLSFLVLFVLSLAYTLRKKAGLLNICLVSFLFILAYLFSAWQPYFSEKTHVLTYGLLGYLAAKDLFGTNKKFLLKSMALALFFVSIISAIDELFQGILPYRVRDIRDFVTNTVGGMFGISLWLTLKSRQKGVNKLC